MTTSPDLNLSVAERLLEAILFASAEPLSTDSLKDQIGEDDDILKLLENLKSFYQDRGINLVETDNHWSFRTSPDLASSLKIKSQPKRKLPRAAAEVLAIIAYHQPITRAEIESIRGVETSRGTLDILLELRWIKPGKRRETPGHPMTWHTTTEFLSHFNLSTLNDLPGVDELKAAGLLDARPVMSSMPREELMEVSDEEDIDEDRDFAEWSKEDSEAAAP